MVSSVSNCVPKLVTDSTIASFAVVTADIELTTPAIAVVLANVSVDISLIKEELKSVTDCAVASFASDNVVKVSFIPDIASDISVVKVVFKSVTN